MSTPRARGSYWGAVALVLALLAPGWVAAVGAITIDERLSFLFWVVSAVAILAPLGLVAAIVGLRRRGHPSAVAWSGRLASLFWATWIGALALKVMLKGEL